MLSMLYITNTLLTGAIPTEIGQLANAHDIYLDYNQLSGTVRRNHSCRKELQTSLCLAHALTHSLLPDFCNDIATLGAWQSDDVGPVVLIRQFTHWGYSNRVWATGKSARRLHR